MIMPQNCRGYRMAAARGFGTNTLLGVGLILIGLMVSSFGIDIGVYLNLQNQLQTMSDAAALGGASQLPLGQTLAQTTAYEFARKNNVGGQPVPDSDITVSTTSNSVIVKATVGFTPMIMNAFCSTSFYAPQQSPGKAGSSGVSYCSPIQLSAGSKAVPAARDTILVIDTSSSMRNLGNNHPMIDVIQAANQFVDLVATQNTQTTDRIALVSFDQNGYLKAHLTDQTASPQFTSIKSQINGLSTFNGSGWNTNYAAGLQTALDELQANGRPNAQKRVIFMTDGMPNLPAPTSYYSYSKYEPYTKCTDMVDDSAAVKKLCTKNSQGQLVCPVLPSSTIPDNLITQAATDCALSYVNTAQSMTDAQTQRAVQMGAIIDTIAISVLDNFKNDTAGNILRRLLKNPNYFPLQLGNMQSMTGGQAYAAYNYDPVGIASVYQQSAKKIRVKLSS